MSKTFKNSPLGKGVRTSLQSLVGVLVGLFLTIWAVPGVPEAVAKYAVDNLAQIALLVGVPSGFVSWLVNKLGI